MGWFRRKPEADVADLLKQQSAECTRKITEKWVNYVNVLKFKSEVSLSEQIETFALPVRKFVENHYPLLATAPPNVFWMMIFVAVLESDTHSSEQVNEAVAQLEKKYAVELGT